MSGSISANHLRGELQPHQLDEAPAHELVVLSHRHSLLQEPWTVGLHLFYASRPEWAWRATRWVGLTAADSTLSLLSSFKVYGDETELRVHAYMIQSQTYARAYCATFSMTGDTHFASLSKSARRLPHLLTDHATAYTCVNAYAWHPSLAYTPTFSYPRYGWWTATAIKGDMGFGQTNDGVTWEALPSPLMDPPLNSETGAVEFFRFVVCPLVDQLFCP